METLTSLLVGLGLAAACGFRVFLPLLIMSIASYTGYLRLETGFHWMGTFPALLAFGTATVLEIAAYHIPWVDNVLDTLAVPAAMVAGTIVTVSALTGLDPFLSWTLAVIGGGGVASSGLARPPVVRVEAAGSFVLAVLAVVVPVVAFTLILLLFLFGARKILAWRRPASA